jgi:Domain of unknown function (DUF4926)
MDLYDVVEVVNDLPDEKLTAGMVGTIVHVFDEPRLAYEVEFSDADGQTVAMLPLTPDQIRPAQPDA